MVVARQHAGCQVVPALRDEDQPAACALQFEPRAIVIQVVGVRQPQRVHELRFLLHQAAVLAGHLGDRQHAELHRRLAGDLVFTAEGVAAGAAGDRALAELDGDIRALNDLDAVDRIQPPARSGQWVGEPGAARQRELLEAEGVVFNEKGRVNLKTYGWETS